ncbi:DUF4382 domain-containing protein [Myxococcaceae bacterium JPH2]|nr:DUF4382 domain-containing protein [Myxococcaceae bacterium JPH2]
MTNLRHLASSLLLATSLLCIAACGDSSKARVTVKLTDAPGDSFEKAVVTISKVYLKGSTEGDSKGDVVLLDSPVTTNLLTLANDAADLVKDAEVPTGTYREMRFVITGGYVQVKQSSGESRVYATSANYEGLPAGTHVDGELQMPSAASSGLKVKFDKDADVTITSEDTQKVILVDFDVAQSFGHVAGNSDRWVMGPVIKGADLQFSGNVKATLRLGAGVTLPGVGDAQVQLSAFSAVLTNELGSKETLAFAAGTDGVYVADFKFLLPGSYQVDVVAPTGVSFATEPAHPLTATVGSGAESSAAFTLTSVAR